MSTPGPHIIVRVSPSSLPPHRATVPDLGGDFARSVLRVPYLRKARLRARRAALCFPFDERHVLSGESSDFYEKLTGRRALMRRVFEQSAFAARAPSGPRAAG